MNQAIEAQMTPVLPKGFQTRPAQMQDLQMVAAMLNAYSRIMLGVEQFRIKDKEADWKLPDFHLDQDTCLVFAPDGRLAGYAEFWDLFAPYVRKNIWVRVHPDYWGLGIGSFLVGWGESRARQRVERAPTGARVSVLTFISAQDTRAQKVLEASGFSLTRTYWHMLVELAKEPVAPVWPSGITVRSLVRGKDERQALLAEYEAYQDQYGFIQEPFENYLERWLYFLNQDDEYDPDLWFLAEENGEIVGISLCFARSIEDPGMGWVGSLGVRRPWRKRGVGLALLRHSIRELHRRGSSKVGLGVDADSLTGATRLYARAGMHPDPAWTSLSYALELHPGIELAVQKI